MSEISIKKIISDLNIKALELGFYPNVKKVWQQYLNKKNILSNIPESVQQSLAFWKKLIQINNLNLNDIYSIKGMSYNKEQKAIDLNNEIISIIKKKMDIDNFSEEKALQFQELLLEKLNLNLLMKQTSRRFEENRDELLLLNTDLILNSKLFNKVKYIVRNHPSIFEKLPIELQSKRELYVLYIKYLPLTYKTVEYSNINNQLLKQFNDDSEIIKILIKNERRYFKSASERIKNNEEIALLAVDNKCSNFKYIGNKLQLNEKFVLKALKVDGGVYQFLNEDFKAKKDFALMAVKNKPRMINAVNQEFLDDKDIVKAALRSENTDIGKVSLRLRNDKEIMNLAIQNIAGSYLYIGDDLKSDPDLLMMAIKETSDFFKKHTCEKHHIDKEIIKVFKNSNLKDDEKVIWDIINKYNVDIFSELNELKNNKKFINKYMEKFDIYVLIENESIRFDGAIIDKAIRWKLENCLFIPVKRDKQNIAENKVYNEKFFKMIGTLFIRENGLIIKAVKKIHYNPELLKDLLNAKKEIGLYIADNLHCWNQSKMSAEFIITLLNHTKSPKIYISLVPRLKENHEILDVLLKLDISNFQFVPQNMLDDLTFMSKYKDVIVENKDKVKKAFMAIEKLIREEELIKEINKIDKIEGTDASMRRKKKI